MSWKPSEIELISAHDNDGDAHDLSARLKLLQDQIDEQSRRAWLLAASDTFKRPNGPIAGFTLNTGQTWRNASSSTSGVVANGRFASSGGNGIAAIDVSGVDAGRSQITYSPIIATGDAWIYTAFREATPCGVVVQRGSDRVRLGVINGSSLTFLQEHLGYPAADERVSLVVDMNKRTARVDLNGKSAIPATALPDLNYGPSVVVRVGGTSTINSLTVYQEILL